MNDHHAFLARQVTFGRLAFGPHERVEGIIDHIKQELEEVEECQLPEGRSNEWVDVVLLAQDGLLRSVRSYLRDWAKKHVRLTETYSHKGVVIFRHGEPTSDYVAKVALQFLTEKRDKNELREWADWREVGEDKAINHKEGSHD
jgi:hypothetical protein